MGEEAWEENLTAERPEGGDPFEPLFAPLGRLVISWALIEQTIDALVAISYKDCGGDALATQIPRALSRKVSFLRKSFVELDDLASVRVEAIELLDRVSAHKWTRHNLVHGVLESASPDWNAFIIVRLDATPQIHKRVRTTYGLSDIEEACTVARILSHDLIRFAVRLLEQRYPGEYVRALRDPGGKATR